MFGFRRSAWTNVCPWAGDAWTFCVLLCVLVFVLTSDSREDACHLRRGACQAKEVLAWLAGWNAGLSDWLAGWLAGWLGWRVLARLEGVLLMLEGVLTMLEEVPAVLGRCLPC